MLIFLVTSTVPIVGIGLGFKNVVIFLLSVEESPNWKASLSLSAFFLLFQVRLPGGGILLFIFKFI